VTELNYVTNAITLHHARMVEKSPGLTSALSVTVPPPKVVDDISKPVCSVRFVPKAGQKARTHVFAKANFVRPAPSYVTSFKKGTVYTPRLKAAHAEDIAT
jgi:hypothetical protein